MLNRRTSLPKYRLYKPKNLAVVRIAGRDLYLGKYNSPESLEKYHRLIAEWLSTGREGNQKIPAWYPLQLRHSRATEIRREFGLEAAQVVLGHKRANVTEVYAERNLEQAIQIAKKVG